MKVIRPFILMAVLCLSMSLNSIQVINGQVINQGETSAVRDLSYDILTKRYLKLPVGLSLENLTLPEKLNTKTILCKESINMHFDDSSNYQKESRYQSQKNLYPSWYLLPDVIYYNSEGTEQIFATKSSLFKGGWFGHKEAVRRRLLDQSEERVQFFETPGKGI